MLARGQVARQAMTGPEAVSGVRCKQKIAKCPVVMRPFSGRLYGVFSQIGSKRKGAAGLRRPIRIRMFWRLRPNHLMISLFRLAVIPSSTGWPGVEPLLFSSVSLSRRPKADSTSPVARRHRQISSRRPEFLDRGDQCVPYRRKRGLLRRCSRLATVPSFIGGKFQEQGGTGFGDVTRLVIRAWFVRKNDAACRCRHSADFAA